MSLPAWRDDALCAQTDPDIFFPERGEPVRDAIAICMDCPVRTACLDHAVTAGEIHGVWGGMSRRERQQIRVAAA